MVAIKEEDEDDEDDEGFSMELPLFIDVEATVSEDKASEGEEEETEPEEEEPDDPDDSDYVDDGAGIDPEDRPKKVQIKKENEDDSNKVWEQANMPVRGYELDDSMMEEVLDDGTIIVRKKTAEDLMQSAAEYKQRADAAMVARGARRLGLLKTNTLCHRTVRCIVLPNSPAADKQVQVAMATSPYLVRDEDIPSFEIVKDKYDSNAFVAFTIPTAPGGGPILPLPAWFADDIEPKKRWYVRDGTVPKKNDATGEWEVPVYAQKVPRRRG